MADKKEDEKVKVFLIKVQPARYNVSAQGVFKKIPTKDELKEMVEAELKVAGAPEYLLKSVSANIDMYGVPTLHRDGSESFVQWKMKGDSLYNSKGYIAMKAITLY